LSRIGKLPVSIPAGIQIGQQGRELLVKGQKGELKQSIHPDMKIVIEENTVRVIKPSENAFHSSLQGLTRTLIQNMVSGLTDGFTKKLEIMGVGFRAELKGKTLVLLLGFSHPIYFVPPENITIEVPVPTGIIIKGSDKQLVGQVAAKIRSFRAPEPYKGKGIRYAGEYVRKKAGKATA